MRLWAKLGRNVFENLPIWPTWERQPLVENSSLVKQLNCQDPQTTTLTTIAFPCATFGTDLALFLRGKAGLTEEAHGVALLVFGQVFQLYDHHANAASDGMAIMPLKTCFV